MALLNLRNVTVGYGGPALLEHIDLAIEPGERLCLLGRNGTGKSTLMRVVSGELLPDEGEVARRQGLRIARMEQEVPAQLPGTVFDAAAVALGAQGELLARYHELSVRVAHEPDAALLFAELERTQHALEAHGGWHFRHQVERVLSHLGLDFEARCDTLSGGMRRRVLLARALVAEPDLLLLDEPTNHLDIDGITWLEERLLGYSGALLFVTHDRTLLQRLATRIVELDRGRLTSWPGDYATFEVHRHQALEAEAAQQALFDRRLAQEEIWIRKGIEARRTRNEGRVRALQAMRAERRARRERPGTVNLRSNEAERSGHIVIEADRISHARAGRTLVRELSTTVMRGDRVGVIGPNGAGKTTLLRLLLGELKPDAGEVRLGTRVQPAYFDQQRAQLDEQRSLLDNVAEGRSAVTVNGETRHVLGYLQDFLFAPQRCRTPVRALSGGERNRLLLAKLFAQPSNLLVLDEPTNDLDLETLELLEELLQSYGGTVLVVSHDRSFLNRLVTSTLVFEGDGRIGEYVGGYDDWLRQRPTPPAPAATPQAPPPARPPPSATRKRSYREQRELDALPGLIEALEEEQHSLHARLADPAFYREQATGVAAARQRLQALERELAALYGRWELLEDIGNG